MDVGRRKHKLESETGQKMEATHIGCKYRSHCAPTETDESRFPVPPGDPFPTLSDRKTLFRFSGDLLNRNSVFLF